MVSLIFLTTCNSPDKKSELKSLPTKEQAIQVYEEGLEALERGDYYFASKKFSEAEILLPQSDWAAKSALMVGYCLYSVNFYDEAILNLERFTKTYPASKNLDYVNYLIAISYYEQILDEEKDVKPVLRYKLELVINQLAAKEISIARYYIKNEKWIAAINRLKVVVEDYDDTIFIEEALFRLVEIYYKIGLENEARAAAVLLGYNYNSSEWYKRSYAILNKDYSTQILKKKKEAKVWYEKDDLIKRKIRKIFRKNER